MGRGGTDISATRESGEVIKVNLDNSLDNFDLYHKSIIPYDVPKGRKSPVSPPVPPRSSVIRTPSFLGSKAKEDDWLSHSIEHVCRKTLYKNIEYRTVNMSEFNEKESAPALKNNIVEKPKPNEYALKDSTNTKVGVATPNNHVIANGKKPNFVTPVNAEKGLKTPKTSTPKSNSFVRRCCRASSFRLRKASAKKDVRFASAEDLSAEELKAETPKCTPRAETSISKDDSLGLCTTISPITSGDALEGIRQRLAFADESQLDAKDGKEEQDTPENSFVSPAALPPDSPLGHYLQWVVEQSGLSSVPSVQQWLKGVRLSVENECLSALQSKSLTKDPALAAVLEIGDAQDAVTALQDRLASVTATAGHVTRRLEQGHWLKFCSSTPGLSSEIGDLIRDYKTVIQNASPYSNKIASHLHRILQSLREIGAKPNRKPETAADFESIRSLLFDIKNTLQTLCNSLYLKELEKIVKVANENMALGCARRAIAALSSIGESGVHMCDLIARVGGVSALLSIVKEASLRPIRCAAIRGLTIICCENGAIHQLEQAGGIECVRTILTDFNASEQERCEATGLLAQITAPWVECSGGTIRRMRENMDTFIESLTKMIKEAKNGDVFLLSAAALANLSFLDPVAVKHIQRHQTFRALMNASRLRDMAGNLFAKDQIATVLANASAEKACHADIVDAGSLIQLICFLQVRPSALQSNAETEACERVQQKSAIALARLCSDRSTAERVLQLQGVQRLVRLCKDPKERNNSNSVLVACLAALRKIASSCGSKEMCDLGAAELVKNELWDSFQQYSSKHESYV
ncbi:protein inscuteable homolog isoform X2 [Ornithodoros turicata]|uniref:protein inscuteable homolog isoform X2 n=1 Tax=Ornithodoros turicata TaxID=34597 RepID=UPI00313959FB